MLTHVHLHGIADILLLFSLCAYKDVIFWESLDALQLLNVQHSHLNVNNPIGCHELFDLHGHICVIIIYLDADASFRADDVWRHLIHACYQREAWLVNASSVALI